MDDEENGERYLSIFQVRTIVFQNLSEGNEEKYE
jgi:hypothetical protein